MPANFQEIAKQPESMNIYKAVGLDGYFKLPPCNIDIKRAHELMTTITEDGLAEITNEADEVVSVPINENTFSEALHFKHGTEDLSKHLSDAERRRGHL